MNIRKLIKKCPEIITRIVVIIHNQITNAKYKKKSANEVFHSIYIENAWEEEESRSGQGSALKETEELFNHLPSTFRKLNVRSVLDLPCGDFNWMQHLLPNLDVDSYVGADIVTELIDQNRQNHSSSKVIFKQINLIEDRLDLADIILCRDCLVHLSFNDIKRVLNNIINSGIKWIATTTYPHETVNRDITTGGWRKLNLQNAPINLPKPVIIIDEKCSEGTYFIDKSLGIWKVSDMKEYQVDA